MLTSKLKPETPGIFASNSVKQPRDHQSMTVATKPSMPSMAAALISRPKPRASQPSVLNQGILEARKTSSAEQYPKALETR